MFSVGVLASWHFNPYHSRNSKFVLQKFKMAKPLVLSSVVLDKVRLSYIIFTICMVFFLFCSTFSSLAMSNVHDKADSTILAQLNLSIFASLFTANVQMETGNKRASLKI